MSERDAWALLDMSNEIQLLGEAEFSIQRHEFTCAANFRLAKQVGGLADAFGDHNAAMPIVSIGYISI